MFKLYNIVWQAVSGKLPANQIPVGFACTRYHGWFQLSSFFHRTPVSSYARLLLRIGSLHRTAIIVFYPAGRVPPQTTLPVAA